jgi:hypothetical protein
MTHDYSSAYPRSAHAEFIVLIAFKSTIIDLPFVKLPPDENFVVISY